LQQLRWSPALLPGNDLAQSPPSNKIICRAQDGSPGQQDPPIEAAAPVAVAADEEEVVAVASRQ
jgi:hypothetical protein